MVEGEGIYVGGTFTGAPEIGARQTGGPCATSGCLESQFNSAKNYFISLSNLMESLPANTIVNNLGNITCLSESESLIIIDVNDTQSWEVSCPIVIL